MAFDYASDLHWDNGMTGGPFGWFDQIDASKLKNDGSSALLIAGDTANHPDDTIDFLNACAPLYDFVVAIQGNHEGYGEAKRTPAPNVRLIDDGRLVVARTAFVGGEMALVAPQVVTDVHAFWDDPEIDRLIILSHFVPTHLVGDAVGFDLTCKSNDLVERLGPPRKDTTIIFGHAHIEFVGKIGGYDLRSNPRGYRGKRRCGSSFAKFAVLDLP